MEAWHLHFGVIQGSAYFKQKEDAYMLSHSTRKILKYHKHGLVQVWILRYMFLRVGAKSRKLVSWKLILPSLRLSVVDIQLICRCCRLRKCMFVTAFLSVATWSTWLCLVGALGSKSPYIRQAVANSILEHIGSFIPATSPTQSAAIDGAYDVRECRDREGKEYIYGGAIRGAYDHARCNFQVLRYPW